MEVLSYGFATVNVPAARAVDDIPTNRIWAKSVTDRKTVLANSRFIPISYSCYRQTTRAKNSVKYLS